MKKSFYITGGIVIGLILIYAILFYLPLKYPYCGGHTWSGGVPACDCIGLTKGSFLWGVNQCVGIRTQCYALSSVTPLSQENFKNNQSTPISDVESFLKIKYTNTTYPKTGEFKIVKVNEKDEYNATICSNGTCINQTISHQYFFKYNIAVDCKYYDENIATNWVR